ncbi:substrate-binding domain-containing protein [Chromobacterium amazonense]|uniref:substrate-binding domain-containing protein n=1 Tax=Chromobacterium amazonense TaxID=1382803 RepID=UPI003F798CCA
MRRRQFLLAVLASTGAWRWAAAGNRKFTVTVVVKSLRNQFFTIMLDGARKHHADHAAEYQLRQEGLQSEGDVKAQVAMLQRAIDRRDDALIVAPADSRAVMPLLLKAIAQGMLVVNIDNKLDERVLAHENVNIPFVGPSNFSGARKVGDYVLAALKPGSKVGIIEGLPQAINAKSRSDGFRESIRIAGMELAGMRWGDWETDKGYQAASALLDAVPDLSALLCGNDNMAIGAAKAVAERHKTGKVLIGGYDNIPAAAPYIASGAIYATADQHPALQMQYALDLVLQALSKHVAQAELQSILQTPVELIKRTAT